MIRTDNGTEYCNNQFDEFTAKNGILHQRTVTHTPEQNGVAEQMNRSIMEKVRSEKKPNLLSLRVFGCKALAHIQKVHHNKLNSKSTECVFVGYSDKSKAYKLYNPQTKRF